MNSQRSDETRHVCCFVIVVKFVGPERRAKRYEFLKVIKLTHGGKKKGHKEEKLLIKLSSKSHKEEKFLIKLLWVTIKKLPNELLYLENLSYSIM